MVPNFKTKAEVLDYLKQNKSLLIKSKKLAVKKADAFVYIPTPKYLDPQEVKKDLGVVGADPTTGLLNVKVVINTTNYLDSHKDVHIPGLWKKSLSETKMPLHLQEHEMCFDKVIADGPDVKAYIQTMSWKDLGFDYPGQTECLKHDSVIRQDRNCFMYDQYLKGYVRNHSVGMFYVSLFLCVDSLDPYWSQEKANWDKYSSQIVNTEDLDTYFWAVTEAKYVEGSAVVKGSNPVTPTEECEEQTADDVTDKNAPPTGTQTKQFFYNPNLL